MMSVIDEIVNLIFKIGKSPTEADAVRRLNVFFKGEQLHRITKQIRNYRKIEKGKICKEYGTLFQQYSLLIEFYFDVSRRIGKKWEGSKNKDETQYRINTSLKLYHKSIQTSFDILTLFETGSLTGCLPLWRMIYENYIVSMYLLSKNETISMMFNDHELVDEFLILKRMAGTTNKRTEIIDRLTDKYGIHFLKPYGWAYEEGEKDIRTFSQIREIVNEKEFYEFYKFASTLLHPSSLSVNRSMFSDGEHGNIKMVGSFLKNLELPYQLTVRLMKAYVDCVVDFFFEVEDSEKQIVKYINNLLLDFVIEYSKIYRINKN